MPPLSAKILGGFFMSNRAKVALDSNGNPVQVLASLKDGAHSRTVDQAGIFIPFMDDIAIFSMIAIGSDILFQTGPSSLSSSDAKHYRAEGEAITEALLGNATGIFVKSASTTDAKIYISEMG